MKWIFLASFLFATMVEAQTVGRQLESNGCVVFNLRQGSQSRVATRICNTADEAPADPIKEESEDSYPKPNYTNRNYHAKPSYYRPSPNSKFKPAPSRGGKKTLFDLLYKQ